MPDRVQDLTNHRKVAVACKNYTDKEVKKAKDELITFFSRNTVDTDDHTNELAYQITAPSGAKLLQLQAIGGNTVKLSPSVASDSTKAMIKTMPSTVYTFDGSKFYGDSEVSENILLLTDGTETNYGITYVVNNGAVSVNGTSTTAFYKSLKTFTLQAGTYYFKSFGATGSNSTYFICLQDTNDNTHIVGYTYANGSFTLTEAITFAYLLVVRNGATVPGGTQFKDMLVKGSTAPTDFKVGFTGIHNIELSGLVVEGMNLIGLQDVVETTTNGITYSISNGRITLKGTANNYTQIFIPLITSISSGTFSYNQFNKVSNYGVYLTDDTSQTHIKNLLTVGSSTSSATNIETSFVANYLYIYVPVNSTVNEHIFTPMLVRGSTAPTSFDPYIAPTTIPIDLTTIEDSNHNKLWADGKLRKNDYLTPYKAHKNRRYVVLNGSEDWYKNENWSSDTNISMYTSIYNNEGVNTSDNTSDFTIANAPNSVTVDQIRTSGNVLYLNFTANGGKINEFTLAKAGEWLANHPLGVEYDLVNPIEVSIDWSSVLRGIQGYPNGSIIAENTHNMEVESLITYNSIIQETLCPSITITRNGVEVETRNLPTITSDGYGINADAHNLRVFSDYEGNAVNKRYTNVNKEDIGTPTWTYSSANQKFSTDTGGIGNKGNTSNILCRDYTTINPTYGSQSVADKTIGTHNAGPQILVKDLEYNDVTTFKTANVGNPLYYELNDASKTETDIDDFDYFFDVEEGDVITFNNSYAQQVYATYSFIIKEAKSNE